ncbi:unnamed protein product, partial [Heterosigma akashiwo]
ARAGGGGPGRAGRPARPRGLRAPRGPPAGGAGGELCAHGRLDPGPHRRRACGRGRHHRVEEPGDVLPGGEGLRGGPGRAVPGRGPPHRGAL